MSGTILGPDGRPVNPKQEQNLLQVIIDTAVETKVNTAVAHVRERSFIRYGAVIIINLIVAIVLYFIGPDIVRDWTREFVAENMNRPVLREAADQIPESTMKEYIDQQFVKVEARVKLVTEKLDFIVNQQEQTVAKSQAAEKKLKVIDHTLGLARNELQEITRISDFTRTVLAAQNDDRKAFDQLEIWAKDAAFPMRKEAAAAYRTVLDAHAQPIHFSGMKVPWSEGVEPAKMSLADPPKCLPISS